MKRVFRLMIAAGIKRVWNAPTAWVWSFQFLRIAQGLLLLPLLNQVLPKQDLAMHFLLMALYQLTPLLDMVFGPTLTRMFGYALGGAKELKAYGLSEETTEGKEPNYPLLGQIVRNTIRFYRWMLLALIVGLAIYGTWVVKAPIAETTSPRTAWLAWWILLAAAPLEFYSGAWAIFLRGMNQMLLTSRLQTAVFAGKFVMSAALLLAGFGLLSIPISTLLTAVLQRQVMRKASLRMLPPAALNAENVNLLPVIWPTSWRTMVQTLSAYFALTSYPNIVTRQFGAFAQAEYSLSWQLIGNILAGLATSWVFVRWPRIAQLRAQRDPEGLRSALWSRLWLQWATFVVGIVALLLLGPWILGWVGIQKNLMPPELLILMSLWVFLDMNVSTWTTFLSTENRIPSLWPVTIANVLSVALAYTLAVKSDWGVASVILGPMIVGALFNFWYWPHAGAVNIGLTWVRMMFELPKRT